MDKASKVFAAAIAAIIAAVIVGGITYTYGMRDAVTVNAVVVSDDPVGFKAGNKGSVRFGRLVTFPSSDATSFKTVGYPGISDPVGTVVSVSVDKWTGEPVPPRDVALSSLLFAAIAGAIAATAGYTYAGTPKRRRGDFTNPSDSTTAVTG